MNNTKLTFALCLLTCCLINSSVTAETIHDCESIQSGVWEDANNWANCNGLYPGLNSDGDDRSALIKSNHVMTLGLEDIAIIAFTMEANSELVIDDQFSTMTLEVNPEPFDSELGQITVDADNFIILSEFNDIRLGGIDGDTNLTLVSNNNIYILGDIGAITPLNSIITGNSASSIQFDSNRTINLDGDVDSTLFESILLNTNSNVTFNLTGAGHLSFGDSIVKVGSNPQRLFINTDNSQVRFNGNVDVGELVVSGNGVTVVNTAEIKTSSSAGTNGQMVFETAVDVLADTTFKIGGNVGELFFNFHLNSSLENNNTHFVNLEIDTVAHLNQVGNFKVLGGLFVTGNGILELNGDINTKGSQSYQVPVIQHDDINYNNITSLIEFTQLITGNDFNMNLNMGGDGFELSNLNFTGIKRLQIGSSGSSVLSADWVTTTTEVQTLLMNQELTTIGDVRMEARTMLFFEPIVLNGGDLALGGSGTVIRRTVSRSVGTEKLLIDLDNGSLSTTPQTIFNLPVDVESGTYSAASSEHYEDIHVKNNAVFEGSAVIDTSLVISDQGKLDLSPSNFPRTETSSLTFVPGMQTTNVQLNGTTAGSEYGQIAVTNGPTILSGSLEVQVTEPISQNDEYIIIDNQSVNGIVNTFSALPEGTTLNNGNLSISYVGGDGNDVVLTATCNQSVTVTYLSFPGSGASTIENDIANACDGAIINFDPKIIATTIFVGNTVVVDKSLTITGDGITMKGPSSSSLFQVTEGNTLTLNQINITETTGNGAIFNEGELILNEVYFANNAHTNLSPGGGGALFNSGQATITNSAFFQNDAEFGGAIYNDIGGNIVITNSTFYQNGQSDSTHGGAIYNTGSTMLINSTLVDSGGNVAGNTLYNSGLDANTVLQNTAIESTSALFECVNDGGGIIVGFNGFTDDGTCDASLFGDAQLGPWTDEGGYANTISPLPGSQLIDAGDDAVCPNTDALGTDRPQRFQCDIGAIEYIENSVPVIQSVSLNGTPLSVCESRIDSTIQGMTVTFSEPMLNADDLLNYVLVYAGEDLNFDIPFDADNQFYNIMGINNDNNPQTPTIDLTFDEDLNDGIYRLELANNITDEFANPLNGAEDSLYQFRIDTSNLLNNGNYDNCDGVNINNEWQYTTQDVGGSAAEWGGAPGEFISDQQDLLGSFHSGSLRVFTFDDNTVYRLSQCQNYSAALPLELSAYLQLQSVFPDEVHFASGGPDLSEVLLQCEYWGDQDCLGNSLDINTEIINNVGSNNNNSVLHHTFNQPPVGTTSVTCTVQLSPSVPDSFTILVDGLKLTAVDVIFIDDFE